MKYAVYILLCSDQTLYAGSTNNLEKRLLEHNTKKSGAHYTKIRRPVTIVYSEECHSLGEARAREAQIKKLSRTQKQRLIAQKKP